MDVLTNKQYLQYKYISRYATFPVFYNTQDNKYVYGITAQLDDSTPYVEVNVMQGDNFDSLSDYYYGRPDYYWIIADYNRIQDPFIDLWSKYKTIKIPVLSNILFEG